MFYASSRRFAFVENRNFSPSCLSDSTDLASSLLVQFSVENSYGIDMLRMYRVVHVSHYALHT